MKKILIIIILVILVLIAGFVNYKKVNSPVTNENPTLLRDCPDEMIINKMPGTEPQSSYYIKNGERKEIGDYDESWVKANCNVLTQEVY